MNRVISYALARVIPAKDKVIFIKLTAFSEVKSIGLV
jgi:hypothetical protein